MDYRLPWYLIGSPIRFNIGFRVRPVEEDITLDQLNVPGYWLRVSKADLPYVRNDISFPHRVHLPLVQRNKVAAGMEQGE